MQREGAQEVRGGGSPVLGEAAEEGERSPRLPIQHRRYGRQQQKLHVRRTRGNRFLRERQDGCAGIRVRERLDQPLCPDIGRVQRRLEQVPLA
jgi:hypothetical protein